MTCAPRTETVSKATATAERWVDLPSSGAKTSSFLLPEIWLARKQRATYHDCPFPLALAVKLKHTGSLASSEAQEGLALGFLSV